MRRASDKVLNVAASYGVDEARVDVWAVGGG